MLLTKRRSLGIVLSLAPAVAVIAMRLRDSHAQSHTPAPDLVTLEAAPYASRVSVRIVRASGEPVRDVAELSVDPASARRGAVVGHYAAVVLATRPSRGAETYTSTLVRVDLNTGASQTLLSGLTDASTPLPLGDAVVVQRGQDGPAPDERGVLVQRTDALALDHVTLADGRVRTIWQGRGQLAMPVCVLPSSEVVVFHVEGGDGTLFAVDPARNTTRTIFGPFTPIARDFSCDDNAIVFLRAPQGGPWRAVRVSAAANTPEVTLMDGLGFRAAPFAHDNHVWVDIDMRGLSRVDNKSAFLAPSAEPSNDVVLGARGPWLIVSRVLPSHEEVLVVNPSARTVFTRDVSATAVEPIGFAL